MNPIAVEKPFIGELLIQENRLFASLSDGDFDGPETSLFVSGRDSDLLSLGDVLGKRLKACRGRFTFKQESEEPSCQAQDDQEKYESNQ